MTLPRSPQPENSPSLSGNTADIPVRHFDAPAETGAVVCATRAIKIDFPPPPGLHASPGYDASAAHKIRYHAQGRGRLLFRLFGEELDVDRVVQAVVAQLDLAEATPFGSPQTVVIWDDSWSLRAVVTPVGDGADAMVYDPDGGPRVMRYASRKARP